MITNKKEKHTDFFDVKDVVMKHPATKIFLIAGSILVLIGISGYVLKLINFTMTNYKTLQKTMNT